MGFPLPTNIDAAYPDDPNSPARKAHQQAHDSAHGLLNSVNMGTYPPNLVFDGDSQVANGTVVALSAVEYGDSFPALATSGIDPRSTLTNLGIGGQTVATMSTNAAANVDTLLVANTRNILPVWAGTNDLYFGATAASAYATITAYHTARRTAGWKTIAYTILPRTNAGTPAAYEADRLTVNTNIRTNWATFADALCDIALDTRLQTPSNTAYFSDAVHCTLAGRSVVARLTKKTLATLGIIIGSNPQLQGLVSPSISKGTLGIGEGCTQSITTGTLNTGFGHYSLQAMTTGGSNSAFGAISLYANTSGVYNTACGVSAMFSNSTGSLNISVGANSLYNNLTGSNNTVIGTNGCFSATGSDQTAVGYQTLYAPAGTAGNATTTGLRQTAFGFQTGQSSATQRNDITVVGYQALAGADDATALGSGAQALHASSVALGKGAVTTAASQVMIGARDVEITDTTKGVILKSPNGTRYRITVADNGALTTTVV